MIYDIDYLSSSRFEAMTGDPQTAVVSITDPGGSDARVPAGFGPVLRLKFDDLDETSLCGGSTGRPMSAHEAQSVVAFLARIHSAPEISGLLVHCEMGRSRSAAVAWYALAFGGRMTSERRIDGINLMVLRMLEDVSGRQLPRPTGMLVPAGFSLSVRDCSSC